LGFVPEEDGFAGPAWDPVGFVPTSLLLTTSLLWGLFVRDEVGLFTAAGFFFADVFPTAFEVGFFAFFLTFFATIYTFPKSPAALKLYYRLNCRQFKKAKV
jgi:hypothetical protein